MKIKKGFVVRDVAGNTVAVPTGDLVNEIKAIINLNETGKFTWELLQNEDLSIDEIAEKLVERYKIDKERAKLDTQKFIEQLQNANVFE